MKSKGQLSMQKVNLEYKNKYWLSVTFFLNFYCLPQVTSVELCPFEIKDFFASQIE